MGFLLQPHINITLHKILKPQKKCSQYFESGNNQPQ